jgi:hypothetical protein
VKFTILCATYYALPLALSIACIHFTTSLTSDMRQVYINRSVTSALESLIVFLTFNQPQSPIQCWRIGTRIQERRWKWNAYRHIIPSAIVLLLVLLNLTVSLLNCRFYLGSKCDGGSKRASIIWLLYICYTMGANLGILYIKVAISVWSRGNLQ